MAPFPPDDYDQEQEQDTRLALISSHGTSVDVVSTTGVRVWPVDLSETDTTDG